MNKAVRNVTSFSVGTDRYSVIILATSIPERMRNLGNRSLLPITDKISLIDKQVEYISHIFPNAEIILVAGFEADKLMNHVPVGIIQVENEKYSEVETVRSLSIGLRAATRDHIIFIYGHTAFQRDILSSISNKSALLINNYEHNTLNIGCCINNDIVENLHFDLPNKWSGIGIVSGLELRLLKSFCWNRSKDNLFIFEALNSIINSGGQLLAKQTYNKIIPIDVPQSLEIARKILK